MTLIKELRRRNVFKVASVYVVTTWIILQIVAVVSPSLHLPVVFGTIVTVVLAIGFPLVCIFAWAFELTPEGLKFTHQVEDDESIREQTGSKINYLLAISLVLALAFIGYEKLFAFTVDDTVERSIAVLPFEDMSPDKSQEYFGDGIAEEILNSLARTNKLLVISRTSSFIFKNANADIRQIGEQLDVNYVLEGSVRKDNNMVRVTAQLIEVDTGTHIWSQTYDRKLDGIFALQDELTFAITQALKLNLLPEDVEKEAGMTSKPEAYDLFIKARGMSYQRTSEALQQAEKLLLEAIQIDPDFWLAKAQLAIVYNFSLDYGGFSPDEVEKNIKSLFWQLQRAPDFPLKYVALSTYAPYQNQFADRTELLAKAYEGAPNDELVQNLYVLALEDSQKAISIREAIIRTNPKSVVNYSNLIYLYVQNGFADKARALNLTLNAQFPNATPTVSSNMYIHYEMDKDFKASLAALNNYHGDTTSGLRVGKVNLNILTGHIDIALSDIHQQLVLYPQNESDFSISYYLLMQLNRVGKLSESQQASLSTLPFSQSFIDDGTSEFFLLLGDKRPYVALKHLQNTSAAEFAKKMDANRLSPYLYAAIMKSEGDSSYAREVMQFLPDNLMEFCASQQVSNWVCPLMMYLDEDVSDVQQFEMYQHSLANLDFGAPGIEAFMFTSPVYFGVRSHPEFIATANSFMDDTYRKYNPDVIP